MRTFVIGDVHGMVDTLNRLVVKLDLRRGDRICWLGDYVDKGPNSIEALMMVRMLVSQYPGSVALCGNHEESVMALWKKYEKAGTWEGLRKVEREPWIKDLDPSMLAWMKALPLVARPLPGVVLVHGGMSPRYFEKHDEIGEIPAAWHKGGGKRMSRMRRFLRIRHVYKADHEKAGQMVTLGDEGESTQPWGDWYDGREGFAFYGHDPQRSGSPVLHRHAMGLDTGAVFGGRLTAAVIEENERDPLDNGTTNFVTVTTADPIRVTLVSVRASKPYAPWLEAFEPN